MFMFKSISNFADSTKKNYWYCIKFYTCYISSVVVNFRNIKFLFIALKIPCFLQGRIKPATLFKDDLHSIKSTRVGHSYEFSAPK